jgi:carbamoyl-phosphate synthase large subunit
VESLNILVTAASRRVPLVRAFQAALQGFGRRGRVIVTDVNPLSPAVHIADRWYHVPLATSPDYLDAIAAICDAEGIDLIVPTIDDELELFGSAAEWFRARGVRVAVSPMVTSQICNDKLATSAHLRNLGIAAAKTWRPVDLPELAPLPLFVKPRFGRGGVAAFAAHTERELSFFSSYVQDAVVQEFLDGPEFTIDVLCSFTHDVIAVVPRERVVVRAGVMDRGRTVKDDALIELGLAIARILPFAGAANIQCRIVNGRPVVFEINPRFSGGIPLTIAAGADFPSYLVELALGRKVAPRIGQFRGDLWMTSYENAIFVGATDLATGRVPPEVIGDVA